MSQSKTLTDDELKVPTGGEGNPPPNTPRIRCPEAAPAPVQTTVTPPAPTMNPAPTFKPAPTFNPAPTFTPNVHEDTDGIILSMATRVKT